MFSFKGTSFFVLTNNKKTKGWFNNQPFLNQPKPKLNQKPNHLSMVSKLRYLLFVVHKKQAYVKKVYKN
jgi:hypothetical protein